MNSSVKQLERLSLCLRSKFLSIDGTEKYVWKTSDSQYFETAFVTLNYRKIPRVICVSSQIGCPIACQFCATGKTFIRNLTDEEIIHQVTNLLRYKSEEWIYKEDEKFEISFMAMGEPLLNFDNVNKAIQFFGNEFRERIEITVSTVGIVPKIYQLGIESYGCIVDLQLSLHSANSITRRMLIPSLAYDIGEVIQASKWYSDKTGRKVCINYLLLKNVNDDEKECQSLINLLDPIHFYVKLSRLNAEVSLYSPSDVIKTNKFELLLRTAGFQTKRFESQGTDIGAGCGQLISGLPKVE